VAEDYREFDPQNVVLSIGGTPIQGFASGTFIEVDQDSDAFSDVAGAHGDVSRARIHDERGTITVTLVQGSSSNLLLSGLINADRAARNGAGVFPIFLRDRGGSSIYEGARCWVRKAPAAPFGTEIQNRVWVIRVAKLKRIDGGA
jgi:hypothetical protein